MAVDETIRKRWEREDKTKHMAKLGKRVLLEWMKYWTRNMWPPCTLDRVPEDSFMAYQQVKFLIKNQPEVTKKDIFGFHNNLTTIVEDSEDPQECYDREIAYIEHWLKSKGVEVEEE